MRVIAGSARRTTLSTPRGTGTRPTTDRIKETLFNILAPTIVDAAFLDLFAGSGGVGIEALSRGARTAVFVDTDTEAIACIKENLKKTKLADRARVMQDSAMSALRKLEESSITFDFIFVDPPYGQDLEKDVLFYLVLSSLMDDQTWVILEMKTEEEIDWILDLGFEIDREKIYGSNKHVFVGRPRKELA